jgi:hypothetical protein
MRTVAALLAVVVAASALEASSVFRAWANKYGKVYTVAESSRRFAIFKSNVEAIERLNAEGHGATFGINRFSDLTNEEFGRLYTMRSGWPKSHPRDPEVVADTLVATADFRHAVPCPLTPPLTRTRVLLLS